MGYLSKMKVFGGSLRGVALTNCATDRTKTICLPTKVGGDIKIYQIDFTDLFYS
jgi:hypothetical protein